MLLDDLLILSRYFTFLHFSFLHFTSHLFLFYYLFKLSCTKKHYVYNPYYISHISHTLSFYNILHYIKSEICIGRRFSENCFHCYSQQIISAVANESLIPCSLIRAPETHNL